MAEVLWPESVLQVLMELPDREREIIRVWLFWNRENRPFSQ